MAKFPILSQTAIQAHDQISFPAWVSATETLRILSGDAVTQSGIGCAAPILQKISITDHRPKSDPATIIERVRRLDSDRAFVDASTIIHRAGDILLQLLPDDRAKPQPNGASNLVTVDGQVSND